MAGFRVRHTLATKLVNELVEAADEKVLAKTIARYGRVDLLCIDELGYTELDGGRGTFPDPRLCAAIGRPPHLRREHHRDRHRVLPTRQPRATRAQKAAAD
ncbi:ATP-binding protein [Streptomyces sp. ID-01-6.2a]|uniref:ATP-binding protein n=1 Tax=Streptomyces caniscabiei TaxID=2746961 RepID=A0A927L2B7_9ACTN|nr:ATP-binding protein [Streptomyces caniscabiei]